jgi:hypothetical protein
MSETKNEFERIPGSVEAASNKSGVVVRPHYSHELAVYELEGTNYIVPFEYGARGKQTFRYYYVDCAYQKDAWGVRLPKELLDRMRHDLPKAHAALGIECVIM